MANLVLTLKDLRDEVLAYRDETGDTGTTKTIVDNAIRAAHERLLTTDDWSFMVWDTPETFALVVGQSLYTLHQEFGKTYYFYNRTRNTYLVEEPPRMLDTLEPYTTVNKEPKHFMLWGRTPVQTQPSSSSVITISSSSASDTTAAKAITVRGVTTNGTTTESITPNGTSAVAGTTSFTKILNVTKGAAWTGTMTMTSNAAAVTNLKLLPTENGRSYQQMFILEPTDAADTIEYRFYRQPSPLTNDTDVPDIPPPFSRILVWEALLAIAGYDTDITPAALNVWKGSRDELRVQMEQRYLEGQSVSAQPRQVRDLSQSTYADVPRIYRN